MNNMIIPESGDFDAWPQRSAYCLAIDWDGSCKDTMTAKWLNGFNLAITEIWPSLKPFQDRVDQVCRDVNMFDDQTAGVQRFVALMIMMRIWADEELPVPDLSKFFEAVEAVEAAGQSHGMDTYLKLQKQYGYNLEPLRWSDLSDEFIARSARSAIIFDNCRQTLDTFKDRCDLLVVSASKTESVLEDIILDGMTGYFTALLGQDFLPKPATLAGLRRRYDRVMFIGDTKYDARAAKDAGVNFFRIRTGDESNSWSEAKEAVENFFK